MRQSKALCLLLLLHGTAACASAVEPSVAAVRGLLERLLPSYPHRNAFVFETIAPEQGKDVFEIETHQGRVVIRGNNGVSLAMGLNWYLKYTCHCHVSWCGKQLDLPDPLPAVTKKIRRVAWAKHRYFLNYCCFGYSLPWWDFDQWERLIDWMALNGINTPLAVTGQEAVWQAVCRRLGMTDAQITEYLAGPPFLPFQWMGCLDGWGGPLPQSWIDGHVVLQQKILARQRALGMTPVLQGFTGHLPAALVKRYPDATVHTINWIEWQTHLLDPLDPGFAEIARVWMEEQTRYYGTNHLYAADTFIEMTPPKGDLPYLGDLSRAIYSGMSQSDPEAVWILQGWAFMYKRSFWTQPRIAAFLDAIPDQRMLALDLFCESTPMWHQTEAFCGKPWLWCNVHSFGCAVHLGGALQRNNEGLMAARQDPKSARLTGLGFVNEGLDTNVVAYDLMYEMAWRTAPVTLDAWIDGYAHYRYGRTQADAQKAWRILTRTVYGAPNRTRSIIDHTPTMTPGKGLPPYSNTELAEAWHCLLHAASDLGTTDTYGFDLVNVARQVLSNHAGMLHLELVDSFQARDLQRFEKACTRFLGLIRDLDELLATRDEFLLGPWLEDAKRWGTNPAEQRILQWNARRVLTLWGQGPAIDDYARKEWSGMLSAYYGKRWAWYLDELGDSLRKKATFDDAQFNSKLRQWMDAWSDGQEAYPIHATGDSVEVAQRLWTKYHQAFKPLKPNAPSLTTGKPVTCSHALPEYGPGLANDGWSHNTHAFWATDVTQDPEAWWQVDLETPTKVGRVVVVGFFGDERSYGFTVQGSLDGRSWETLVDRQDNRERATARGYACRFTPCQLRYLRVTQTHNSANTGRHLVEVMAYAQ
jgi:alpha-N-acetylglucosaminidase